MKQAENDKMNELMAKYLAGEASPAEVTEMLLWIDSSEENRNSFEQLSVIWNESNVAGYNSIAVNENAAWDKFLHSIQSSAPVHIIRFHWWKLVAAMIIIIAGASIVYLINNAKSRSGEEIVVNAFNQVITDTLPDKSVITLNKQAELSYPAVFNKKQRNVRLKGEAFFDIRADKNKPFIIDAGNVKVKVVGTSFNIKAGDSTVEVIVRSGIVKVIRGEEIIALKKGEQTTIAGNAAPMEKNNSTDQLFNYYVSNTFVCDNTPLWKLVDKLNEAYSTNIIIERKALRNMPLNVTFKNESLDTIFEVLSQTLLLKVIKKGDDIILQ
ncbi:FecR family protein [Terrimonas sp.]|uniref:FecR family protein n=1 Tax=Terrimonas sp. TaxID=1914338 RepID=UPI0010570829|nr:FecR family protein [Terrimonas sp.]